ncbi:MAG: GDP-mannose 4,6-dehydratase [Candidatus Xenobium sp.]
MRVLVTGIAGMVGSHLAEYLVEHVREAEIFGAVRPGGSTGNLARISDRVHLVECDICSISSVEEMLTACQPDRLFHLAGQSSVQVSFRNPHETLKTNVNGLVNLLEVLRRQRPECRVLVPGTSEEYGAQDGILDEDAALLPLSPYALSKAIQDLTAFQYARSYKLHIIRTRAFNHTGPRRPTMYAEADFAAQIARIEGGAQDTVRVGNLEAVRDFSDVRDVVRGYWMALEQGQVGEVYNLCSGVGRSIREVLEGLLARSATTPRVVFEPERLRPSDPPRILGNDSKFRELTGWMPEIPFEQTLSDILKEQRDLARARSQNQESDPS